MKKQKSSTQKKQLQLSKKTISSLTSKRGNQLGGNASFVNCQDTDTRCVTHCATC
jgi:hypothetical protein